MTATTVAPTVSPETEEAPARERQSFRGRTLFDLSNQIQYSTDDLFVASQDAPIITDPARLLTPVATGAWIPCPNTKAHYFGYCSDCHDSMYLYRDTREAAPHLGYCGPNSDMGIVGVPSWQMPQYERFYFGPPGGFSESELADDDTQPITIEEPPIEDDDTQPCTVGVPWPEDDDPVWLTGEDVNSDDDQPAVSHDDHNPACLLVDSAVSQGGAVYEVWQDGYYESGRIQVIALDGDQWRVTVSYHDGYRLNFEMVDGLGEGKRLVARSFRYEELIDATLTPAEVA